MDLTRNNILQRYGIAPAARLSSGMEAEVYAYGPGAVLKLYSSTLRLAELCSLRDFYAGLDRQRVPYALPRIYTVAQEADFVITTEQRLAGTPLSAQLPGLAAAELDAVMQRYLTAALAVSQIAAPPGWDRYKLFDPDHLSECSRGDWNQFLLRLLTQKLEQVAPYLSRDVPQFEPNVQQLAVALGQPYRGELRLVHGDFFPGNLLADEQRAITALLDFGLLTMYGDYLFDIATGWIFFDMYDDLKSQARERYLAIVLDRLGAQVRGTLYRYILMYSILSANTYAPDCTDGHYRWCVANLSNQHYWEAME